MSIHEKRGDERPVPVGEIQGGVYTEKRAPISEEGGSMPGLRRGLVRATRGFQ